MRPYRHIEPALLRPHYFFWSAAGAGLRARLTGVDAPVRAGRAVVARGYGIAARSWGRGGEGAGEAGRAVARDVQDVAPPPRRSGKCSANAHAALPSATGLHSLHSNES